MPPRESNRGAVKECNFSYHVSYSLKLLKGGYVRDDIGNYYRGS